MRLFVLALLLLTLAAPAAAQQPSAAELSLEARIALEDPGAEPRVALRYDLDRIGPERLQMDIDMSMEMSMAGQQMSTPVPTMRTVVAITGVERDGDLLRLTYNVEAPTIVGTSNADPMMVAAMQQALAGMGTITGQMTMDDRGNVSASSVDLSGVDPAMRQQLESTVKSVEQALVPLPVEPVGPGARWAATVAVSANGVALEQTATYTVVAIEGRTARLRVDISQRADAQALAVPGMPEGASAELLSYSGSGSSEVSLQLDRAVCDSVGNVDVSMAMRTGDPASGMTFDIGMTMGMNLRISALPAE
ncbi:MAG: hypothetical protein H6700_00215 [Myxococcales bacterium]|nr:hypothetical protein [Myxococcales bacterium]MCB9521153.1 hypothetical protein [Myxococcales bacterium]MCB9530179.1 hypothetical protein [Myxococcales bacterium]